MKLGSEENHSPNPEYWVKMSVAGWFDQERKKSFGSSRVRRVGRAVRGMPDDLYKKFVNSKEL